MTTDKINKLIDIAAEKIYEASHVVALVGAGMSAESGIPTYRGSGGIWTKIGERFFLGCLNLFLEVLEENLLDKLKSRSET